MEKRRLQSKRFKQLLSLALTLVMVLSMLPLQPARAAEDATTLYLVPNADWKADNARFAVYYWSGSVTGWSDMTDADGDGRYEGTIPAGYSNLIFCRMSSAATENNWDNKWNQTDDLTVPTDGTNCYTVAEGTLDKGGGTWSVYTPPLVLYLKPNHWTADGAAFSAYFFNDSSSVWVSMTDGDADGVYEVTVPEGYTQDSSVIFARMNPAMQDQGWDGRWNQTGELTVPEDDKVLYTVPDGVWDASDNTNWSALPEDETPTEYYLEGYINAANYTGTAYKFVEGTYTGTFTADTYVYVKSSKGVAYMTDGWLGSVTSATLKNAATLSSPDKLQLPAGVEVTLSLVENADGTLTLSYTTGTDEPDIPEGYTAVKLHFLKPDSWAAVVNAWVWLPNGSDIPGYEDYHTTWPGKAISMNASHPGWYDLTVATEDPTAFSFIFNDGTNQTSDLSTGTVTGDTELWIKGDEVLTVAPAEWTGDYDYTAHIHFQKPDSWGSTVNAWIWDANGKIPGYEDYNTTWPGKAVEADAINTGWYNVSVTMDENAGFSFIFNDGSDQTANLSTGKLQVETHLWIVNGAVQTSAPSGWVDPDRTVHVPGTFPGPSWDAASNQMTYDSKLGLYVYTFKNVPAGGYYYKIAINGSWDENYGANGEAGGQDILVSVPSAQDVTIWYNDRTHKTLNSVTYELGADVSLSGTGIPAGTKLTDPDLTGLYTVTVQLPAGTYSDLTITYGDFSTTFGEFTLTSGKAVTFTFDPATYLASHNGSNVKVQTGNIYYNSKDQAYKSPYGAVKAGQDVLFSIDTGVDASSVSLIVPGQKPVALEKNGAASNGVQKWSGTARFPSIGEYQYYFAISNGSDLIFYTDDNYNAYYKKGDYGTGTVRDQQNLFPYDIVVYEADFETPDWMKDAVIYQIFPDRFFDGDLANNHAQTDARGEVDYEYVADWYMLPELPSLTSDPNYPVYALKGDGEWSNEIYGGDLEGIVERIDYLKALGVNVIYLNPVFWSISNHRYDACDYMTIDPILGTLGDFEELVAVAEANDMHIILDGVFNHVSDDSVYFDRYYNFLGKSEKIGAYPYWAYVYDYMAEENATRAEAEAAAKAYFAENYGITDYSYTQWFEVYNTPMTGTVDNIGLRAGKAVYSYDGWWGYDSMPIIYSTNGSEYQTGNWAEEIIYNQDGSSVTQYWISKGNNGWRLDVANEVSDETWQNFRDSVKALDSDAVIIGEIWADSTRYLLGDMYDSVMNYVFRDAVAGFARGYLINRDNKAQMWDSNLTAGEALTILEILRERYPEEAFYAMMNLVGSHDTARILSYLDDVEDDRYVEDIANSFPMYETTSNRAKQLQYVVSFIQFTYAGAPTVYYGDEIGMVGADDPDDRRAFTWGKGNREILEWYATLAAVREQYPALRTGSVEAFAPHADVMGYVRRDEASALIVLANRSASAKEVTLDLEALNVSAQALTELLSGTDHTVSDNTVKVTVPAYRGVILVDSGEVKAFSIDSDALAPGYDPAYIVPQRSSEAHTHTFDKKVAEDAYFAADVTCEAGTSYYYSCACGEEGTETFTQGQALGHSYGDWTVTKEATATENGAMERVCGRCRKAETMAIYAVLKGNGAKWSRGSGDGTSFTFNSGTDTVVEVYVNGQLLDAKYYTVGKDGTLTLTAEYLQTLNVGGQELKVAYAGGIAEVVFTVADAVNSGTGGNADTGDSFSYAWIVVMLASLAAIALLILLRKRLFAR